MPPPLPGLSACQLFVFYDVIFFTLKSVKKKEKKRSRNIDKSNIFRTIIIIISKYMYLNRLLCLAEYSKCVFFSNTKEKCVLFSTETRSRNRTIRGVTIRRVSRYTRCDTTNDGIGIHLSI